MPNTVLVVEDDPNAARIIADLLGPLGFISTISHTVTQGREKLEAFPWDLIIIDEHLPDGRGTELMSLAATICPHAILMFNTVNDDQTDIARAFAAGAHYFIVKPNGFKKMLAAIGNADRLLHPKTPQLFSSR